jgi:hypothetical protein
MLKIVGIVIAAAIAIVLIVAATKPDTFRVERSIDIAAPAEKIFPLIDDYRSWLAWSPYEKKDPAMKRTYSGPAAGKGAMYAWDGNKDIGAGSMETLESTPYSKIVIRLDFIKPFEAHNIAEFALAPQGAGTRVVWSIHGPMPLLSKVMGLFFDMDKMVGQDFESGLRDLKAAAEK